MTNKCFVFLKVWNDISCYHEKEWICEDSEKLLKKMGLA